MSDQLNGVREIVKEGPPSSEDVKEAINICTAVLVGAITSVPPELGAQLPNILRCLRNYQAMAHDRETSYGDPNEVRCGACSGFFIPPSKLPKDALHRRFCVPCIKEMPGEDRRGQMIDESWGWCVVCGNVQVSAADGMDTCDDCVRKG